MKRGSAPVGLNGHAVPRSRKRPTGMIILALVILVPALIGFGMKFKELLLLVGDEEGAFTVVPVLNYLLVTFGFLLLFGWAVFHGMFRDIEKPKYTMMANEQRLDEQEREREQEQEEMAKEWWQDEHA
ncbi:MAG TPA: hypothetical protein VK395_36125 [Gemmataceae bacterium]|nr:hypothetical protein [Gemmataceae bacterium]